MKFFITKLYFLLLTNCTISNYTQTRYCFLDEPNAPGKPDIIDYDNKSVTLKWEPPKSDGGRPITHYVIEMLNKYQPDWVELMPTETNACEFKVPGLKERMAYQFRVRAINKAGKSAPSPPTESHVVRHKNRKYQNINLDEVFVEKVYIMKNLQEFCCLLST